MQDKCAKGQLRNKTIAQKNSREKEKFLNETIAICGKRPFYAIVLLRNCLATSFEPFSTERMINRIFENVWNAQIIKHVAWNIAQLAAHTLKLPEKGWNRPKLKPIITRCKPRFTQLKHLEKEKK